MALNQLLVAALPLACSMLGSLLALPSPGDPFDSFGFDEHPHWFSGGGGGDYPHDSLKHGTDPIPSIVKKLPHEDKSFKKSATPPLGSAYCQEIGPKDGQTKCYRCKDPNGGSTYEHCSYSSNRAKARSSRSNGGALGTGSFDSAIAASSHSEPSTYRFGDDYFQPESAAEQAELEPSSSDNCKRERRDSMLCMVCRDPKTNGKYEQCSYVGNQPTKQQQQPKAKARKYREPRREEHRRGGREHRPERQRKHRQRDEPENESGHGEEAKEGQGSDKTYLGYPSYIGGYDKDEEEAEEGKGESGPRSGKLKSAEKGCKSVKRDGETCTVCTDPKTGAKSEKCNYSFEPKDKAYAYSKSKSFGYPESSGSPKSYDHHHHHHDHDHDHHHHHHGDQHEHGAGDDDADEEGYNAEAESRQESAEDYSSSYASPDYIRSESERISKKVANKGDCREEKRDGMLCKICKDPRSGDDFEQCNYSYEPDDKVYAYSKSKHFGSASPAGGGGSEYAGESAEEHSQPEETSYSSSVLDYMPKPSESQHSSVYSSYATPAPPPLQSPSKEQEGISGSRVDSGFYDASKRRAEIEKIVQTMGAQDRSKCSKSQRGGMTCYSCRDDKGFSDEECVFVTEPEPEAHQSSLHVTSRPSATTVSTTLATSSSTSTSSSSSSTSTSSSTSSSLGGSGSSRRRRRRRSHEAKKEDAHEEAPFLDEELHEAEPYDYVAETRPLYDKVLGLTLPAYMVNRSKQELEFDQSVENSKF